MCCIWDVCVWIEYGGGVGSFEFIIIFRWDNVVVDDEDIIGFFGFEGVC